MGWFSDATYDDAFTPTSLGLLSFITRVWGFLLSSITVQMACSVPMGTAASLGIDNAVELEAGTLPSLSSAHCSCSSAPFLPPQASAPPSFDLTRSQHAEDFVASSETGWSSGTIAGACGKFSEINENSLAFVSAD